ncbi:MAG: hypothetical protein C0600_08035 [Ignavibacteria bacterium]|nr:MAG: hypothetical protein C0600_08035 [Ignavibacteria bacterium]
MIVSVDGMPRGYGRHGLYAVDGREELFAVLKVQECIGTSAHDTFLCIVSERRKGEKRVWEGCIRSCLNFIRNFEFDRFLQWKRQFLAWQNVKKTNGYQDPIPFFQVNKK